MQVRRRADAVLVSTCVWHVWLECGGLVEGIGWEAMFVSLLVGDMFGSGTEFSWWMEGLDPAGGMNGCSTQ